MPPIPCRIPTHGDMTPFLQHVLARDIVRYVGEPFAVVVAASRAIAEDAAERIESIGSRCPLWPTREPRSEIRRRRPMHPAGNVASQWSFDLGDVEAALRRLPSP